MHTILMNKRQHIALNIVVLTREVNHPMTPIVYSCHRCRSPHCWINSYSVAIHTSCGIDQAIHFIKLVVPTA